MPDPPAEVQAADRVDRPEPLATRVPDPEPPPAVDADARFALLVGIDDYPGDASDLPSGAVDVAAMWGVLVDRFGYPPDHVLVLADRQATRGRILRALRQHLGRAGADGTALVYFSGHGTRLDDNRAAADPEADGRDEALYVWADGGAEQGAFVLDDELGAALAALPTRRVLVILDACHSGTGTRGGGARAVKEVRPADLVGWLTPEARAVRAMPAPPSAHVLLAAARDRESALAGLDGEPSVFTGVLVDALGSARSTDPLANLMAGVQRRVRALSRRYGSEHTPQIEGPPGLRVADVLGAPRLP